MEKMANLTEEKFIAFRRIRWNHARITSLGMQVQLREQSPVTGNAVPETAYCRWAEKKWQQRALWAEVVLCGTV